jgi:AraC-like DNA-binding protein
LHFHVSTFGMYGFAILSSPDFRQAARFAQQYYQLAAADADIAFKEEGDLGRWIINPVSLPSVDATVYRFIVELNFGLSVSLHRDVMGSAFIPRELRVTYGSPNGRRSNTDSFGCPALFGRAENAMVFDKNWLDGPATLGNAVTYLQLVELCDQLIREMQLRSGLAGSVREALLHNLAMPLSLDAVSRRLKLPTRTLKRKLQEEGTSYRKIVDELRTQMAIRYLRETKLTVEEIAASLGYSDAASFRYAFRRWAKQPPGKFRLTTDFSSTTGRGAQ